MSRRGFTLVELSLVIVLTLILTSVVIHGLRGIGSWRAAAAIGRVQADVLYARDQALLSGRRTLCVFDATSQTYEIKQEAAPASGSISATTIEHPLTGQPWLVSLQDLSGDVRIGPAPTPTFGFGADGMLLASSGAPAGGDIDVTFSSGATLTIHAGSGLPAEGLRAHAGPVARPPGRQREMRPRATGRSDSRRCSGQRPPRPHAAWAATNSEGLQLSRGSGLGPSVQWQSRIDRAAGRGKRRR